MRLPNFGGEFSTGVHLNHKNRVSIKDMSDVLFNFQMNPLTEFPGTSVNGFTSGRGDYSGNGCRWSGWGGRGGWIWGMRGYGVG